MKNRKNCTLGTLFRSTAIILIASLTISNPAFALRQTGLEESPKTKSEVVSRLVGVPLLPQSALQASGVEEGRDPFPVFRQSATEALNARFHASVGLDSPDGDGVHTGLVYLDGSSLTDATGIVYRYALGSPTVTLRFLRQGKWLWTETIDVADHDLLRTTVTDYARGLLAVPIGAMDLPQFLKMSVAAGKAPSLKILEEIIVFDRAGAVPPDATPPAQAGAEETRHALAGRFADFARVYGPNYGHRQTILHMKYNQAARSGRQAQTGIFLVPGGILRQYRDDSSSGGTRGFDDLSDLAGPDRPELVLTEPYAIAGKEGEELAVPVVFATENDTIVVPVDPARPVVMAGNSYISSILVMGRGVDESGTSVLFQWHYFHRLGDPPQDSLRNIREDLPALLRLIAARRPLRNIRVVISADADVAGVFQPQDLQERWAGQGVQTVTVFPRLRVDAAPVATGDAFGFALMKGELFSNLDWARNAEELDSDRERFRVWTWEGLETETVEPLMLQELTYAEAVTRAGAAPAQLTARVFPAVPVFRIGQPVLVRLNMIGRTGGFQIATYVESGAGVTETLRLTIPKSAPETVEIERSTQSNVGEDSDVTTLQIGRPYQSPLGLSLSIRRGKGVIVRPAAAVTGTLIELVVPEQPATAPTAAGIEEQVRQALATAVEAMQDRGGMVVIDAPVIGSAVGLNALLSRIQVPSGRILVVGADEELAARYPGVQVAASAKDAVPLIMGSPYAGSVSVLGSDLLIELQDLLSGVPGIHVSGFTLRFGLRPLLILLGVTSEVLDKINWDTTESILRGLDQSA